MTQFYRRHSRGRPPHHDVLTPAEWRVLEYLRTGTPNAEIAVRLGLSPNTVKTHVSNILAKLDLERREELRDWGGEPAPASQRALRRLPLALPFIGSFRPDFGLVAKVAFVAGGLAAAATVAVAVAVAVDNDETRRATPAECVTGEAARNPIDLNGGELPAARQFDTIPDGEAFICLDVPELQVPGDWEVHEVGAIRSHSLERFAPGEPTTADGAYRVIGITYVNERTGASQPPSLSLSAIPVTDPSASCGPERVPLASPARPLDNVTLQGTEATLYEHIDIASGQYSIWICWERADLQLGALATFERAADVDARRDILALLETVE